MCTSESKTNRSSQLPLIVFPKKAGNFIIYLKSMFTNNYNRDKNQTNRNRISAKGSQTTRKEGFYDINI